MKIPRQRLAAARRPRSTARPAALPDTSRLTPQRSRRRHVTPQPPPAAAGRRRHRRRLRRRRSSLGGAAAAQAAVAPARADIGVSAYPFDLGQVRLTAGRWLDNQNRTLSYLRFVDVDRLLYNFRANHRLSTNGAAANGGWDAPNFPFRTHMQGHFLTAWAQAYAVLGDTTCRDKANYMVAELAKCQANNGAAGFSAGYLSGFPESDFTALESAHAEQRQRARTTASTRPWPACSTCGATSAAPRPATCCWPSPAGSTGAPAG